MCRQFEKISDQLTIPRPDLYKVLSECLSQFTESIYMVCRPPTECECHIHVRFQELQELTNPELRQSYEEKLQIYSAGTRILNRLFRPLNSTFVKREREKKGEHIEPVEIVRRY
jgi:hypothetical protein